MAHVDQATTASATSDRVSVSHLPDGPSGSPAGVHQARENTLSRREIEGLIAEGHTVVILDGYVLKLDKWLENHPGGRLPLLQMVGVDATCEIKA
jgi:hypothetical protein